jgi:hypothetical protein
MVGNIYNSTQKNRGADDEVNGRVVRLAPTLQPRRTRAVRPHIMLADNQQMPLKLFLQLLALLFVLAVTDSSQGSTIKRRQ